MDNLEVNLDMRKMILTRLTMLKDTDNISSVN